MGKSIKLKFDRDSKLMVKYIAVAKSIVGDGFQESQIGSLEYKVTGEVLLKCDGFEYTIPSVDELEVVTSAMDSIMTKTSFRIKKIDDTVTTLPHKFYGIRGTNVLIDYESELSGSDELPDE